MKTEEHASGMLFESLQSFFIDTFFKYALDSA